MQKIYLTATALKAIAIAAAKKDIRYYLNGVLIEAVADETRVVATDGHRLAAFRMPTENVGLAAQTTQFIIPNDVVAQIKTSKHPEMDLVWIEIGNSVFTLVHAGDKRIGFKPIDGAFPSYRRAIATGVLSGEVAQFYGPYMADFQKMASALTGDSSARPHIEHNGRNAARITVDSLGAFVGILMPLKDVVPCAVTWPA